MGEYRNFADCVSKNQDKKDPEAYCATIMRHVEGATGKIFLPVAFEVKGEEVVGYANAPIVDRGDKNYRDLIPADTWLKALVEFFETGAKINFMHRPKFIVGRTKSVLITDKGPYLTTIPTKSWVKEAIHSGDLRGYSIEYKLYEFVLRPPVDGDPRPVREFKRFSLLRVAYVDEPMNPGSYISIGGKQVNLKEYAIHFERATNGGGTVTVTAKDDAAMAAISDYLADGIKDKKMLPEIAQAIGVKAEEITGEIVYEVVREEEGGLKALFAKFKDDLLTALKLEKKGAQQLDPNDAVHTMLEQLLNGLKALGLDAAKMSAMEASIAAIKSALPTEKPLAEILKGLQQKAEDQSLADQVAENAKNITLLATAVDKLVGAKTSLVPSGTPGEDDPWGATGKGAKFLK